MLDIILKFLSSLFFVISISLGLSKLLNTKIKFLSLKSIICVIVMSSFSILNYYITNQFIRITIFTFVEMVYCYILLKDKIKRCASATIYSQLILMISEMIFAFALTIIFKYDATKIVEKQFGSFFSNVIISIIYLIIIYRKFISKIFKQILRIVESIKGLTFLIFLSIFMILSNVLTMIMYYKVDFLKLLIFNTSMMVIYFFIIIYIFKTKSNLTKVNNKYMLSIESLKEHEAILEKYKMANHEIKNQFMTVRNMIDPKDTETKKYIDNVLELKIKDNEKLLKKLNKIPACGLRALFYSKLLTMDSNNIKHKFNIDKNVKTVDFINIDEYLMLDICQIIGVFLDNAIEEVTNKKNTLISIDIYSDNKSIFIKISNPCLDIQINDIDKSGYTTKGKNKGYGLSLVKNIIENNSKLRNVREFNNKVFSQILVIKK